MRKQEYSVTVNKFNIRHKYSKLNHSNTVRVNLDLSKIPFIVGPTLGANL